MSSWLTVTVQIGNLVSIAYAFFLQKHVPARWAFIPISITMAIGPAIGIIIGFFWQTKTKIGHSEYSVLLSTLGACSGLVGGLSTVTLFPWASLYGALMVAAVSSGSGANGIVTAILAITQNPTSGSAKAHFTMRTYFFIIAGIFAISLICFMVVSLSPYFEQWKAPSISTSIIKNHSLFASTLPGDDFEDDYLSPQLSDSFKRNFSSTRFARMDESQKRAAILARSSINNYSTNGSAPSDSDGTGSDNMGPGVNKFAQASSDSDRPLALPHVDDDDDLGISPSSINSSYIKDDVNEALLSEDENLTAAEATLFLPTTPHVTEIPMRELLWHIRSPLMYQFYINILYYCVMGLIPFAFGRLGKERSTQFVFWTNIIGMVLNATGRLVTFKWRFFFPRTFSIIQTPFFAFVFVVCFLQKFQIPEVLDYFVVVSYGCFSFLFGYADTINFQYPIKLLEGFANEIQRASRWVAVANQLGSLVGAMIGFILSVAVLSHYKY